MQQSEILSLVERLIPVYGAPDFEDVLTQLTTDAPPSAKVLAKMELNRIMAPCIKSIDLRGRVQGECREYELDGRKHWLDDIALNSYHRKIKRFGGYTEGVWEALVNGRKNSRVTHNDSKHRTNESLTDPDSPFKVEPIHLGFSLKRVEKRLKMSTQIKISLSNDLEIHATSNDISPSGLKLKVPSAFELNLGDTFDAFFTELHEQTNLEELIQGISYRIIGIDENTDNESIRWVRAIRLTETDVIDRAIIITLDSHAKKTHHNNQDKIIRARTHSYENAFIRHTTALPLFFNGAELKYALLNESNQDTWEYWHDERNQQSLGHLFNPERMAELTKAGIRNSSNVIYSFVHQHQGKDLHYSMMLPEANREERQLFWHLGARRNSWKVFRLNMFELNAEEVANFINSTPEYEKNKLELTHVGILQEISGLETRRDYLLTEKPNIETNLLNRFRHPRKVTGAPKGTYFDIISRRKEDRYVFNSPVELVVNSNQVVRGKTVNFSSQGLNIRLASPILVSKNALAQVSFIELQLYDSSTPLTKVPYSIVRVSPDGLNLQVKIEDSSRTTRTITFLKKLITHNKEKLTQLPEYLPSADLLDSMYDSVLTRLTSTPVYVAKVRQNLQPVAIGVNYPLASHLKIFKTIGHAEHFSLEPFFKKRSNRLLKIPLRPIENPKPIYSELYLAVIKNKSGDIEAIHTRLDSEFNSLKERILFIKKSKQLGEFFAFRISGLPVTADKSELLNKKLAELSGVSAHHARNLEKEIRSMAGYCELIDISEEVLIRLELT
ncbi:PilZ domain-containing protein [Vibrio sp. JC009]|uniref:PilZ domain-containing protein n=1 Tax=Vibrio sp. JC009 TaxID=2912314 RepID=UPI0023AFFABA|nr:PilZ domain-containing protein [Vibrio sp. JC009]WED21210.1 PilZ domain-containing protein [Vibrio sp. JC009]